jgi:hypothetical protein
MGMYLLQGNAAFFARSYKLNWPGGREGGIGEGGIGEGGIKDGGIEERKFGIEGLFLV